VPDRSAVGGDLAHPELIFRRRDPGVSPIHARAGVDDAKGLGVILYGAAHAHADRRMPKGRDVLPASGEHVLRLRAETVGGRGPVFDMIRHVSVVVEDQGQPGCRLLHGPLQESDVVLHAQGGPVFLQVRRGRRVACGDAGWIFGKRLAVDGLILLLAGFAGAEFVMRRVEEHAVKGVAGQAFP